jgi:hypothetical protein
VPCVPEIDLGSMQLNFVVSTNAPAIRIWEGYGFRKVGCIPFAFDHPTRGLVDTYPARVRKQSYSINILWER